MPYFLWSCLRTCQCQPLFFYMSEHNTDDLIVIQVDTNKAHWRFFLVLFDRAYKIKQLLFISYSSNLKDKKDITKIVLKLWNILKTK